MDQEQMAEEILSMVQNMRVNHGGRKHAENSRSGRGTVLNYLYEHGGTASPGELCEHMRVTTPRVTAVLNELESEDLIIREMADCDRRRICVNLTEKGREAVKNRREKKRAEILRLLDRLGEEDSAALLRICRVWKEMEDNQ